MLRILEVMVTSEVYDVRILGVMVTSEVLDV